MNATPAPPRVSAVIAARDAAATLARALDSLRAQTMREWEAIVVDDTSTDATAAVARGYAAVDPRIRLLSVRAGGAAAARNAGLSMARGRHVLFLDADDWIAPAHLRSLLDLAAAEPAAGVCYCAYRHVTPDGRLGPVDWQPDVGRDPVAAFARRCGITIHAALVERAAVEAVGRFDASLRTCEDWDLWQRLARAGVRFAGIDAPLAFYRMRPGSLSRRHQQLLRDALTVLARGGLATRDAALAAACFAAWCAAAEIGAGRDGVALLDGTAPGLALVADRASLATAVLDGLATGGAMTVPMLADAWTRLAGPLDALLERLERSAGTPGLGRGLLYDIERAVLAACDLATPVSLRLTIGARVDLDRPIDDLAPPAGVDVARLRLCRGPVVLRHAELPVLGPLAASDLAGLAPTVPAEPRPPATATVPVLVYHRIAADGPAALAPYRVAPRRFADQLALLRRHGCQPLSSAALRWHIGARTPMPDRSVLITFDDGYRDFADCAWPLLRAAGFTAEVFIPTAAIGGAADWDAAHGPPAPLLDWATVTALAQEGVVFGSHFATHLDGTTLSTADLADQLAQSRAAIEARLGSVPLACAAPYGAVDERFAWLAAGAGYHVGFSCRPTRAGLDDPPLLLPRITVAGDWDLAAYAAALGLGR